MTISIIPERSGEDPVVPLETAATADEARGELVGIMGHKRKIHGLRMVSFGIMIIIVVSMGIMIHGWGSLMMV